MPLINHQNGKKVGAVLVASLILGSSVVQTNFAQKQHTSSKANQSAKSSQSSQANQSTLPDTGDVSSLGLGALGAVLMKHHLHLKEASILVSNFSLENI